MKRIPHLLLLLHASAILATAQSVTEPQPDGLDKIRYQLILPEEKAPEVVKPNEPNPFNKGEGGTLKAEDSSSEENKVKEIMLSMRSSGIVVDAIDGNVRSVMLGPLKLERGMVVPPVVSDQEVRLRVNSLSDTAIELFWIEKKKNTALPPRPVIIPINIKPSVRYHLPTANTAETGKSNTKDLSRPFGLQMQAGMPSPTQPAVSNSPPPRAIPVDETGTSNAPASTAVAQDKPSDKEPATTTPPQVPETHPANLFMKLLMDKAMPTQQQPPQGK